MSTTVKWAGHEFHVLLKESAWSDAGGIYIFTGSVDAIWQPYYIGKAESFKTRMPTHERWDEAVALGATHVHAMVVPLAADRDAKEKFLIGAFQPPLNDHHT
jgi:hypothetical protein